MRNNAVTNQATVVSLADAPVNLRRCAGILRAVSANDRAAYLDTLASSLEQLPPALDPKCLRGIAVLLMEQARQTPAYVDTKPLEEGAFYLNHIACGLEHPGLVANANTCSDQVTITMSQLEHAISGVVVAVHTPANEFTDDDKEAAEQALHMLMDRVRAALNNSTPERRE